MITKMIRPHRQSCAKAEMAKEKRVLFIRLVFSRLGRQATICIVLSISMLFFELPAYPHPQDTTSGRTYNAPTIFDPNRDAFKDLAEALQEALRTDRNVLIEVGGEWCTWCHIMDSFYKTNSDLLALREQNYVLMKVDYSEEHPNTRFLSRFPAIDGVPHIFILDAKGKLIRSEDTSELEQGDSYNLERFKRFLEKYAPKKRK